MTTPADTTVAILDSFQKNYGLDFSQLVADQTLSTTDKLAKAVPLLRPAIAKRLNVPEAAIPLSSELQIESVPNIFFDRPTLDKLHTATGDQIYNWVLYYASRLELMQEETAPSTLATVMGTSGLLSVSSLMANQVAAKLATAERITTSVVLAAMTAALLSPTVTGAVLVTIAVILLGLLFFFASVVREVCGIVVNEIPDTNLVVSGWKNGLTGATGRDLYMRHGKMTAFMNEPVQNTNLCGAMIAEDEEGGKVAFYPGGIYCCEKNFGFYGVDGMMLFRSADTAECFVVLFACPYSAKNGTNASVRPGPFGSTDEQMACYDELNDGRRVEVDTSSERYRIKTAINSESGGSVACLSFIAPK